MGDMINRLVHRWRRGSAPGVLPAGYLLIVLGLLGAILGSMLIASLTADFRASIEVSRSAIASIGETVDVIDDVAIATTESIGSISRSASSAAATTESARDGLANVAEFLDRGLPRDIEAIQGALPGAISAADAIDTTLGALALFGVNYAPEEPFGDSLRSVQDTLANLPEEIRQQSASIQTLVPLADTLASDVSDLAQSLEDLESRLSGVQALAATYDATIVEAQMALEGTDQSLGRTVLLLRIVLGLASAGSVVVGLALISIHRALGHNDWKHETVVAERVPTG